MLDNKQIIIRLLLSILLSSFIGIDRESTKKPAGLRTHILVSLGSTLIMLLSIYINGNFQQDSFYYSDRIAAQVISGIGFLGAGTIRVNLDIALKKFSNKYDILNSLASIDSIIEVSQSG